MRLRIRTSIREERPALLALGGVTAVVLAVLAAVFLLGDQRTVRIVATTPSDGATVSGTTPVFSLTFGTLVDRAEVERRLTITPASQFSTRWRGRTVELALSGSLPPASYTVSVAAGAIGANGESLSNTFELRFRVRAPGIVYATGDAPQERLVVREDGSQPRDVIIAQRIRGYDISPDGRTVAVIAQDENKPRLKIVDIATGAARLVVDADKTFVGSVTWSVDGQALAVMRRDILPDGSFGVPRLWLMRPTGDFVGQLDPEGKPALAPVWSPDQQRIAYISPATGELIVRNLTTQEGQVLGNPRGGQPAWSVDSKLVVFESIPAGAQTGTLPPQPIHIEALDGSTKRDIGVPGEIRGNPVFLDAATVLSVRASLATRRPRATFTSNPWWTGD